MALLKDIRHLIKNMDRLSNGQATIREIGEDMSIIKIDIRPNDGLYRGGLFTFQIKFNTEIYPSKGPEVQCLTHIYHPNIDTEKGENYENFGCLSNVCLNMLKDWQPSYSLDDLVNGILFLFYQPNLNDPYSSYFETKITDDQFATNVRKSLLGKLEIQGVKFDRNICFRKKRNSIVETNRYQAKKSKNIRQPTQENKMVLRKRTRKCYF